MVVGMLTAVFENEHGGDDGSSFNGVPGTAPPKGNLLVHSSSSLCFALKALIHGGCVLDRHTNVT